MKTIDCLCFGACVVDEMEETGALSLGGDAANQAVMISKLGLTAQLCALTGKDSSGEWIAQKLKQSHLSTETLIQKENLITTHSLIHLDQNRERSFTVTGKAHREMRKDDFPMHLLHNCRAISLGSMFTLHHLEEDGLKEIFHAAKEAGCLTFSDTSTDRHCKGLKKVSEFLPLIDYFMPSYDEAVLLTGFTNPDEIADCLLLSQAQCVILKLSNQGAVLYRKGQKIYVPAFSADVVDTTGAGDNFCAGFIASLLSGLTEQQALINACWMGARAVEQYGTSASLFRPLPYSLDIQKAEE